ncbi:MAG: sigma-70 family RNA polymerase sigma factor [Planctomycetota bacterium]
MEAKHPIEAEELLAQHQWVRRLAQRLVGAGQADDVVQETYLAAWQRRGEGPRGDLRAWLGGVVRNLVRRHRRAVTLRELHEQRAATAAVDGVTQMRLHAALAQAVLALREPYRGAILQRYLEEASYAQIAVRQGVSEATVRKRVSRALSVLRRRLEGERSSGSWSLVLAVAGTRDATAKIAGGSTPAVPLGGVCMVGKVGMMVAAMAAVTTVGWLVWREGPKPDSTPAAVAPPAAPADSVDPAPVPARAGGPPATALAKASRRSLAAGPRQPSGSVALRADRDRDLHGWVLDPQGERVAGARIEVRRVQLREMTPLVTDPGHGPREGRVVAASHTDAQGEFALPLTPGLAYDLWVQAAGFPPAAVTDRYAGERVEVQLRPAAELYGKVTRATDGSPVPAARLVGWQDDARHLKAFEGTTDRAGQFSFRGLAAGRLRIRVVADDLVQERDDLRIELVAGRRQRRDFALRRGLRVAGTVTDAVTKRPIAGAVVGVGWSQECSATTNARGEYALRGVPRSGRCQLHARAKGYGRTVAELAPGPLRTRTVEFTLVAGRRVRGRIVDPQRNPVEGAYVAAVGLAPFAGHGGTGDGAGGDWRAVRSSAAGAFAIADLRADQSHALLVVRRGYGSVVLPFPVHELHRADLDLGVVVLTAGGEIAGRVVDEEGIGVADARVRLVPTGAKQVAAGPDQSWNRWQDDALAVGQRTARSDDLGRFRFTDLEASRYVVEVSRYGGGGLTLGEEFDGSARAAVRVGLGETVAEVTVVLPLQSSIAGRIVDDRGQPIGGILVLLEPLTPSAEDSVNLVTGPDGRFAFLGLPHGSFSLQAHPTAIGTGARPAPYLPAQLEQVYSGERNLELTLERTQLLSGLVYHADDRVAAKASVAAFDAAGRELDLTFTDVEGRFFLSIPPAVSARLVAKPAPEGAPFWDQTSIAAIPAAQSVERTDVTSGRGDVVLRLPPQSR